MTDEVIEPNILILEIGITLNQCESFFEKHSQLIVLEKVRHEHTGIENNWIFDMCYKQREFEDCVCQYFKTRSMWGNCRCFKCFPFPHYVFDATLLNAFDDSTIVSRFCKEVHV